MDIITLAAANAYTDKKVAEVGGSGGGEIPFIYITVAPNHINGDGAKLTDSESIALENALLSGATTVKIRYSVGYGYEDETIFKLATTYRGRDVEAYSYLAPSMYSGVVTFTRVRANYWIAYKTLDS